METTLLSLAKSVMSGVAGQAKSIITEEVALQLGVHKDLVFINDEFEMMQNFLMAADEEGGEKKVVRTWVKQVRDLGYDVEDSLLDYALHLDKPPSWWRFLCTLRPRRAIAKEIKDLKARVEDVSHRNLRYRLIEDPTTSKLAAATAADRYLSSTASVFGVDRARRAAKDDKNKKVDLVELITKGSQELMVITVWGTTNDAGKMSTIRKAYDDRRVTESFRCRAWVKLTHPFNPAEFLESIVRQFYGNPGGLSLTPRQRRTMGVHISRSMSLKQAKLEDEYDKHVNNNKYMIVIEDLSTVTEWDWLKLYLPNNKNGSRIVVSTQQIELASLCVGEPNQVSELKQFSSDQTLYIFHPEDWELAEAREEVIKLISQDSKHREIISVWGTDGPKKTHLLRSIYDGNDLDCNKFQKRAWITVSHPIHPIDGQVTSLVLEFKARFPVKRGLADGVGMSWDGLNPLQVKISLNPFQSPSIHLGKGLTEQGLKEENQHAMETAELMKVLIRLMGGQKCLIVLDGISTSEQWNSLVNYLPGNEGCSSTIVLTTTEQIVAEHCSVKSQNIYKVVLEDDAAINANRNKDSDLAQSAWMKAREEVIKLISQDSMQREIFSVWGTYSSENTALVKSIYDGKELDSNDKFQKRAWITLSHSSSDQVSLLLEIKASSLLEHNSEAVELIQELAKLLQNQKYLISVDGISGKEEWDLLVNHLPGEENASRIVVSTTEQSVAEHCSGPGKGQNTYKLDVQKVDDDNNKNKEKQHGNMPESKASSTQKGTTQEEEEPRLIGREKEISRITNMLLHGDAATSCQVIFVSGMGGVGKTALVDSIYHSPDIKKRFPIRAWADVLQPFDHEEFLTSLALQLKKAPSQNSSTFYKNMLSLTQSSSTQTSEESVELLLEGAMHLIVVDGLSSVTEWDKLACLRKAAQNRSGSWIIVTTREAGLGKQCCVPENIVVVECLKYAEAFELFKTKVSKTAENFESDPEMNEQAKHIVRKCGGLPLAIATIGGFLSSRLATTMEWRKLNDHIGVELEINSSLESINKMVISSYKGLPYNLKACFLYLSVFPEGHIVRRRRLVRRWIAEGYSSEMLTMSAEEVGEEYITELISRSMIQPSKTRANNCGGVSLCRVNNLMHAISISKSKEEKLVSILDDSGFSLSSRDKVRHLVVSSTWSRDEKNALERIMDVSRMRSLTVFGEWRRFLVSSKMRLLRVLDLEDATGLRDSDLVPVGKLRHLKYLSLRGSQGIFNLPKSFGKLLNLETLDIRGTLVTTLPAGMVNLQKLSYLRAGYIPDNEKDSSINLVQAIVATVTLCKSCISMGSADVQQREEALKNFGPLFCFFISVLLKRVDPHGVKLPRRIGKLKNLHTLGVVNVTRGKSGIKELKKLTKLRKLGVTGINKGNSKGLCSAISDMSLLESLSVRSEGDNGLQDCLNGMSSGLTNLQTLKIYGNLAKLPEWMNNKLRNLTKLTLRSTLLTYEAAVKVLEQLEKLVILCMWSDTFKKGEFHIRFRADTFPTLKRLEISHLKGLQSVNFEEKAMAGLEFLLVERCELFCEGGFEGVHNLKKLKEVWVKGRHSTEFKEELQRKVGSTTTLIMVDERH